MTSEGHPHARLRRCLETRSSALLIRAAAAELRVVPLDDALDICLALFELEPHTYPRTAARWGSRLAIERKLDLVDAQLTLAALATLPGPGARGGVEALVEISGRSLGTSCVSDPVPCGGVSDPVPCGGRGVSCPP